MFQKGEKMGIEQFKDMVFELLNDADDVGISDIDTNDKENTFKIFLQNGNIFELKCHQVV